jgi:hypothetical protein
VNSTWRKHLIICLFLGLPAIPIYFLDLAFTDEEGGNWITLDFRGFVFWTYIFCSMVFSVILLLTGFPFTQSCCAQPPSPVDSEL